MIDLLREMDFKDGVVEHISFNIDFDKPFEDQIWELNEDLLQVKYIRGHGVYILDLGWYPGNEITPISGLKLVVAKDGDWNNLFFVRRCHSEKELMDLLKEAISKIMSSS